MKALFDGGQDCGCNNIGAGSAPMSTEAGALMDGSRTQFRVGASSTGTGATLSDLLQALPFVKAKPAFGAHTAFSPTPAIEMSVQVQWIKSLVEAGFYTLATAEVADVTSELDSPVTFKLGRIGARVKVLAIDAAATVPGTAQDFAALQAQAAAVSVLRALDKALTRGDAAYNEFSGASQIVSMLASLGITRSATSAGDAALPGELREMMAQITPNGPSGAGNTLDCLFGGPKAQRKLQALAAGTEGASGWRRDSRTGRNVFHYQGIPFYRTNALETETGSIWAANLGPDGLNVVHAYGSSDSFGVVLEETPVTKATGARELTAHGAWALALWDPAALFELKSVSFASL